ncbi:MAG TPA: restriction endonuclease [Burkholderiales bacterium]|nr:restriction endonuclease [Burkholderiales bacterium]
MHRGTVSEHAKARTEWPWWLGVILAGAAYVILKWIIPSLAGSSGPLKPLVATAQSSAALVAIMFLAYAALSLGLAFRRRRALDLETSLATLRALPRERFAHFLEAAFRREGYEMSSPASGDSAIDAVLTRGNERLLVQYRHWRNATLGAAMLQALCDCAGEESAAGCVFVTAGNYTPEAVRFAAGKPVRLIGGRQLERMLRDLERSSGPLR